MNFVEAIKAMQEGKICFRKLDPGILFKIKDGNTYFKEKGCEWELENNIFELPDYMAIDWEVSSKEYVKTASVEDILLDYEEDILMIVLDNDGDYLTTIDENGCIKTIDLDSNCYEKVGDYPLVKNAIILLDEVRKELNK